MPAEMLRVSLKPVNFFDKNPALDVPPSTQAFNRSTLLSGQHHQPAGTLPANGNGTNGHSSNGHNCANC